LCVRAIVLVIVVIGLSARAHADDMVKAKALYDEGLRHYNLAEYPAAITAWKQSYLLSKRPLLLFNIGQAYRLSGDCKAALMFYDNYSREEGTPAPELAEAINECKKPPPETPPPPQKPQTVRTIEFGPMPKLVGDPPSRGLQIGGLVGIGVGVVAGGAVAYFTYDSNKQSERLDDFSGTWTVEQKGIEARGRRDDVIAYVSGGVAAAGVITGAVLLWLGRDQRELQIEMAPVAGGGAASLRVGF
jgi:hypothetical protein